MKASKYCLSLLQAIDSITSQTNKIIPLVLTNHIFTPSRGKDQNIMTGSQQLLVLLSGKMHL